MERKQIILTIVISLLTSLVAVMIWMQIAPQSLNSVNGKKEIYSAIKTEGDPILFPSQINVAYEGKRYSLVYYPLSDTSIIYKVYDRVEKKITSYQNASGVYAPTDDIILFIEPARVTYYRKDTPEIIEIEESALDPQTETYASTSDFPLSFYVDYSEPSTISIRLGVFQREDQIGNERVVRSLARYVTLNFPTE